MARKLTPKQRKFADEYLSTGNASEAYRRAYSPTKQSAKTLGRNAQKLIKNSLIVAYLASIQKPAQEKVAKAYEVTLEGITAMLIDDRRRADALEDTAAAVSCSRECAMSLAKLHGLIVDTVNNLNDKFVVGVEQLLDEGGFERKHKLGVATASRASNHLN